MTYGNFKTLLEVSTAFNLRVDESHYLFLEAKPIEPSAHLKQTLNKYSSPESITKKIKGFGTKSPSRGHRSLLPYFTNHL